MYINLKCYLLVTSQLVRTRTTMEISSTPIAFCVLIKHGIFMLYNYSSTETLLSLQLFSCIYILRLTCVNTFFIIIITSEAKLQYDNKLI